MTRTVRSSTRRRRTPPAVVVTGGMGSGKSTFCRFMKAGAEVAHLDADRFVRGLLLFSRPVQASLARMFGAEVLDERGRVNRTLLAERVFSHGRDRRRLEALLHPIVRKRMAHRVAALKRSGLVGIVLAEIPLLAEGGRPDWCDVVVSIEADLEVRLARLETRGLDRQAALRRIRRQTNDESRRLLADHVVRNNGSPAALKAKAVRLRARILSRQS